MNSRPVDSARSPLASETSADSAGPASAERARPPRLQIEVFLNESSKKELATDVRRGLTAEPRSLPAKYFYDELGSRLFDRICDTPEYYQTRTEQALLEGVAGPLVSELRPSHLVELGSGAARKTRTLIEAMRHDARQAHYVPFDVSESMLRASAGGLLRDYPWLSVHGIVGDYERHLSHIPHGERRLFVFLGSTIGNFEELEARRFVARITASMRPGDRFLLGVDLVKEARVLDAAYNDEQGITAAFNKNVLAVINRELRANFDAEQFQHVAFFNAAQSQIEMHLEARRAQRVRLAALELELDFKEGERIRTEISRKFTRQTVSQLLSAGGQELVSWFASPDDYFALALARPALP